MCGCNSSISTTVCGESKQELRILRNRLVTLYNTEQNANKKQEYKKLLSEIGDMSKTTSCPDKSVLLSIKNYINSEYSKRN